MCRLMPYVEDDQEELTPDVKKIFEINSKEVPEWLNEAIIYSPLIKCFDEDLETQFAKIERLQQKLRDKLNDFDDTYTEQSSDNDESRVQELKDEIKALDAQLKQIEKSRLTMSGSSRSPYSQSLNSIDDQINNAAYVYKNLQKKIGQMQELERNCIANLDEYSNEHKTLLQNLSQTTEDTKKYRASLNEIDAFIKQIRKHKNLLSQRQSQLVQMISKLESTKIESSKQIAKLEDSLSEHQQLISSYHNLEDKIKQQEQRQEDALAKMISAVELCESANADSQKARMTRDIYSDELARIKDVVASTEVKFNDAVAEQESQMKSKFESALSAIANRIKIIESENQQLEATKDGIMKQKNSTSQENSILKATKSDNGFSAFVENISSLKAEIEASFTKKEQIQASIEQSKQNAEALRDKESQTRSFARTENALLLQKKQHYEMELEMQKSVLKEILAKNARLTSENTRLQNEISQLQRANEDAVSDELKNKQTAISEMQIQFDEITKANEKAITEVQQTILSYKQNAEKWKLKATSISTDAQTDNENMENDIASLQDRIESLLNAIIEKKQDSARIKVSIEDSTQEIMHLKDTIQLLEKKQRRNQYEIEKRTAMQLEFARTQQKYKDTIDRADLKIKQKDREIKALKKNASTLSDTESDV